jgi:hypothetical protein
MPRLKPGETGKRALRQNITEAALCKVPRLSNNEIARAFSISKRAVSTARQRMEAVGTISPVHFRETRCGNVIDIRRMTRPSRTPQALSVVE